MFCLSEFEIHGKLYIYLLLVIIEKIFFFLATASALNFRTPCMFMIGGLIIIGTLDKINYFLIKCCNLLKILIVISLN